MQQLSIDPYVMIAEEVYDVLERIESNLKKNIFNNCADAVPQPRADDGAIVLAAAALQLLAAPALRLALAVLPDVAGVTPAGMRGQSPPERTLLQGACAGGGAGRRPHLQTPHSIEPLPPQMLPHRSCFNQVGGGG